MTTHSSILAWRIPRTEEPGRLQSMGSHKESGTTEQPTTQHKECPGCVIFSAKVGTVRTTGITGCPLTVPKVVLKQSLPFSFLHK